MVDQKTKLFVVTGTKINYTGKVSFKFIATEGVPFNELTEIYNRFAWLRLRDKADNEINPFKLMRGEKGAVGNDGVKKWEVFVFESGNGQIMNASAEENPGSETGLASIIKELPGCVILMDRNLFDRFKKICDDLPEIELGFFHYNGELKTA